MTALALCVAAGAVAMTAGLAGRELNGSLRLLLVVAVPTLLAPLFAAGGSTPQRVPSCLPAWALAIALLAAISWFGAGGLPPDRLLVPALLAFAIVLAAELARAVLTRALAVGGGNATRAREAARWLVAAVLWLLAAAPLWLAPLADLASSNGPAVAETIAAMSPLVHLALATGQDLLRTEWFYAHSSLGSLQFRYPSLTAIAAGYAVMVTVLASCRFVLSRRATTTGPLPRALPT